MKTFFQSVPYSGPMEDFKRTHRLRVVGTPNPDATAFEVIIRLRNGDALFHFNPRLDVSICLESGS